MRFTRKSWKDASKLPCQERPAPRMAVSMTLVGVGPGVGFAPPFVPSHFCGPLPSLPSTVWVAGVTGPSKIVFDGPSTRTVTVAAPAAAGTASAAALARTARAPLRVFILISLPFREGFVAFGRRQVSWLPGSPVRAFPGSVAPQWPRAAGPPGHSGGTAPVSHRTSLDPRPLGGGRIHPRAGRPPGAVVYLLRLRLEIETTAASSTAAATAMALATAVAAVWRAADEAICWAPL